MYDSWKIRHNKAERGFTHCIFFDTETWNRRISDDEIEPVLRLGIAQYYRLDRKNKLQDELIFRDGKEFATWLDRKVMKKTTFYVMAHNLSFDFSVCNLAEHLENLNWRLKNAFMESNCIVIAYEKEDKHLVFIDTFNYIKASVKKIGQSIGLEKLSVDFDACSDDELIKYCRRDVEIIAHFVISFIEFFRKYGLGNFGVTTPQCSFNAFRHRFMQHEIRTHSEPGALDLEINSYFGGRNECFYIGQVFEDVYKLDVNSMYPFVMHSFDYPVKLIRIKENVKDLSAVKKNLKNLCAIAYVELNTDEPAYPFRYKNKTIFPVGNFSTYLATPELQYALDHGHVVKIHKIAYYKKARIFKDFVEWFYAKRKHAKEAGNKVESELFKLILNSLYGKFGQRQRDVEIEGYSEKPEYSVMRLYDENGNHIGSIWHFGKAIFKECKEKTPSKHSFIAIASHVTSASRITLWKMIKKAGIENVYYCDTDSIFTNEKGYQKLVDLIDDYELGKLKLEGITSRCIIFGCKDYIYDDEQKTKGIRKNAKGIGFNKWQQEQFPSLRGLIRKYNDLKYRIKLQVKELKRKYEKGLVMKNGRVSPYRFQDSQLVPEMS